MEDLVPLLIFIVIAVVNLLKFTTEKGGRKKQAPSPSGKAPRERGVAPSEGSRPPQRRPSTIEAFFEEIAEKLEPQPTDLPEWPEGRERPNYMEEMEEFETTRAKTYEEEEVPSIPTPPPAPLSHEVAKEAPVIQPEEKVVSLKSAMKAMPSLITNSQGMRIASAPILRSSTAGHIDLPLKDKSVLRKAIIANIVFSPPRAYDVSFNNTITQ
ncbi:MAG: hypothetical protein ABFR47_05135 [Verrucomicrobiota bacterium]